MNDASATLAANRYGVRPDTIHSLYGSSPAEQIVNFFQSKGLSRAAAAGIAGNTKQESSDNPNAPGGGLIQGQGGRTSHGSLQQQLEGVWGELTGPERGTLGALKAAKTPSEAARIFSQRFERPGIPMLGNRERYANEAYGANPPHSQSQGVGRTPPIPGTPPTQTTEVNLPALQKAQSAARIGKLFSPSERKENPLFSSGILSQKAPNPAEFLQTRTTPGTPGTPTPQAPQPTAPQAAGAGKLGGFLGASAPLQIKRIDEGQDIQTRPGEALLAPGDGQVIAVKADPSGFGPSYPVVKITTGPLAGTSWYLGHTDTALRQGDSFKAGQPIAHTSRTGHNAPPGWAELGFANTLGQGNKGQGAATQRYLRGR